MFVIPMDHNARAAVLCPPEKIETKVGIFWDAFILPRKCTGGNH